ncbi:MAG: hypothetical protein Q8862_04835 [Bacteroidota bacterium]|nr:hypothetical protein [Bacteroidota bacterium]
MSERIDHVWNLVSCRLYNELQGEEVDQFNEWIKSIENKILFAECEKIFNSLPMVKKLLELNTEKAWERIEKDINNS